ncbi:MAG: dipeptidase PepE [Flavobacteriales bacterium]|nr:dipeptidase PepE [Flavobacteriia bacterium]NCP05130.1 dipeptidase PepE [Flavobacteriales bacterium]PIV93952.1 MAG: dipeptidase PepE [Flavobacteriaceae bacterium CG17_big_fil_post_rev_8_21_14_2_50_33_15]PIY10369.1 MAG: dipeptidase PepE [Flavobacteriaceae bacterium CG_4_10_14_3_um_filter_33_47]PJB20390.1 MAG: dipeptidase PepE [Flavobacteriaceae bacterium CG_4_9_14_3_um_filter_33_16]
MKNIFVASTSTVHGSGYLEYILEELNVFFKDISTILFIPYARPSGISHDTYTNKVKEAFSKINKKVVGIHTFENPISAIENAQAIFVGGGNTFVLLNQLYKLNLLSVLKNVVSRGTPYLGTSAGSNICGLTIKNTNDMPIVYPPNFNALGLVSFNLNPHYLDPDTTIKHMGETRETRIKEFHVFNNQPVIGLREGSWLLVKGNSIVLKGSLLARVFEPNKTPYEVSPETELNTLK